MSLRVAIFSLIAASCESKLVIIEAIVPVANENETTPKSINNIAKIFSSIEYAVISPYPTVTKVVTVK